MPNLPRSLQVQSPHTYSSVPNSDNPLAWSSLTGVDMVALFRFQDIKFDHSEDPKTHYKVFAELQTISVSATRSVHPVRCLGESAARGYTRGARTFAGSLIFTMFSKDPFEEVSRLDIDHEVYGREPFAIDQIPEFDIIISAVNEMGTTSKALIGGVTLTNYGTTFSIHDIYTEISYTYVARWFIPMTEDIKAFDKTRQLYFEPLGKTAEESAKQMLNSKTSGNGQIEGLANELLQDHPIETMTGKMIRQWGSP